MLPNSVGNAKIKATSRINPQVKDDCSSMRSSREVSAFSLGRSPMPQSVKKGQTQCWECNNAMHHKCMRCSFLTMCSNSKTERVKERKETEKRKLSILPIDKRIKPVDPRTLSPEELTQFELNAALNQFKINFENPKKTKKNRSRFNKSVCRIIEILNPNLLILYKKCGRLKRQQIEEHLFRTSEKSQQTFMWHKAALEFIMERLNIDPYSIITRRHHEVSMLQHNYANELTDVSESSSLDYVESNEISRISRKQIRCHNKNAFTPDSSSEQFLVFVKPTDWLTEITCAHCTLNLRLSEFSKHYATYHCLPIECMDVNETRKISLDPNRLLSRRICPHTLFLVRNVVRNLGGSDFRNFYPLVLTTAVQESFEEDERKWLILWLSGIALSDQIEVCMKVANVAMSSENFDGCPMLRKIYSITNSQNINDINESDAILRLSPDSFIGTTRHGNENIVLEVSVKIANTTGT